MLNNKLVEDKYNNKKSDLNQELEIAVNIYNNTRNSSTGWNIIRK